MMASRRAVAMPRWRKGIALRGSEYRGREVVDAVVGERSRWSVVDKGWAQGDILCLL